MSYPKATFIKTITIKDPDNGSEVELEIHKDPEAGAIFAVESDYVGEMEGNVNSPYGGTLYLPMPE